MEYKEIPEREIDVFKGLKEQQERISKLRKKVDELRIDPKPIFKELITMVEELKAENKRLIDRLEEGRVFWVKIKERRGHFENISFTVPPSRTGEGKNPLKLKD